jgi:signal transduction histidine kinase
MVLLFGTANVGITSTVISTLSFACIFLLEILLNRFVHNNKIIIVIVSISMAACFFLGFDTYFPLFLILLIQLLDITIDEKMFYQILAVALLLVFFIFPPEPVTAAFCVMLTALVLFCRIVQNKLVIYKEMTEAQNERLDEMKKKLSDLKGLTKTLKYTASLEERNRIAARIHDQIVHGISGSIIMLEAAMLIMKDNPVKATNNIEKAITNLREGVDEIRTSLREERAGTYLIGIKDITALLEEFKVSYNKSANLKTNGDLGLISLDVWACIHDNLKECLTNVLKHSNATEFNLTIDVFKKIIKVEYRDNGKGSEDFEKGIGLEAMEERTVAVRGRCFFTKGENDFCITNIFTY